MLKSVALYFLLVLFPQTLWLILSSERTPPLLCDACSFFPASPGQQDTSSTSTTQQHCVAGVLVAAEDDNLTARLCSREGGASSGLEKEDARERTYPQELMGDEMGGWSVTHCLPDLSGPCTIKRRNASLTLHQFLAEFADTEPVIMIGMSSQEDFKAHSTKYQLLKEYGHYPITVATANTHSYRRVDMTLCDYVEQVMRPQSLQGLGNETLYLFGDIDREKWAPLLSLYNLPPLPLPGKDPVLSFGLAGPGTGVPFHVHGPTYAETIYGRKRWFLYPPSHSPAFDPDESTLRWIRHTYPSLEPLDRPLECTLNPGEILFLPNMWWHSTLNVDPVVFMSVFYS